jgi:hypothetical protein
MNLAHIGKTALTVSTGYGFRDFVKKHKKYAYLIGALIVLNEIRGLAVVYAVVKAWWDNGAVGMPL